MKLPLHASSLKLLSISDKQRGILNGIYTFSLRFVAETLKCKRQAEGNMP